MKNLKKLVALTCTAAMLVPTIALAAQTTPSPIELTGDSVIENDNSQEYEYTSVVLPTTNTTTYAFQIDRDGLLPKYDSANTYESNATVYFHAENTPAKIELTTPADYKLYEITKTVHIAAGADQATVEASTLGTALNGSAIADLATTLPANTYYVWVPQTTTDNGLGQWLALDSSNIGDYLKLTDDTTNYTGVELQPDPLSGANIWDGKIYTISYDEITDGEKAVVDYNVTADGTGTITAIDAGLYIEDQTNTGTYTLVDTSNANTYLTYTAATDWYASESDEAIVYNKSTTPIAVSVDVTITAEGLTFSEDGVYTGDSTASVYFTISDGTNETEVNENGTATVYYVLSGATNGYETFQGSTTNSETGSHNYYKYEQPDVTYFEQSFVISATANSETDSDEAWAEYIEAVESGLARPTISVVYNWEEVTATDDVATSKTFEDVDGNKYIVATMNGNGVTIDDGWAEYEDGYVTTTTISGSTYSRSATNNTYTIKWATDMPTSDRKIKTIYASSNNTTFSNVVPTTCYTLTGSSLVIDGTANTAIGAGAVDAVRYFKVTFNDNSFVIITVNVTA